MKILLGIALVLIVYVAGFCHAAIPHVPMAPMAPGVTNPGVKNAENPDVPHAGDDITPVAMDEGGILYYIDITSLQTEDDGIRSVVVLLVDRAGDPKHNGAHRLAGRARFDCAKKRDLDGVGYVISDDGDITDTLAATNGWTATEPGSIAAAMAVIVCAKTKLPAGSVEL